MMKELFGEFLGTLILILLGNGVVAGVVLPKTKSNNSGWIVITMGWGIAVAVAAFVSGTLSPAHLNPAVTFAMALKGTLSWGSVFPYILAQFAGAMVAQILVWLQFKPHYEAEENAGNILATFSTGPAIKNMPKNSKAKPPMPITPPAKSRQNKNVKVCGAVKIRKLRGISEGVNARHKKDAETQNRKKTGWGFGRVMYSKRSSENFSDDLLPYSSHR